MSYCERESSFHRTWAGTQTSKGARSTIHNDQLNSRQGTLRLGKIGPGLATIGVMFIALNSWSLQSNTGTTIAEKLKDAILFALWTVGIVLVFISE